MGQDGKGEGRENETRECKEEGIGKEREEPALYQ